LPGSYLSTMRQSAILRCPLSAQKTAFLLVSGVLRRAKSLESGRARWCLARYEPDELPDCSTPRIHLSEITMQLKTRPATVVGVIANAATSARFARVIGHAPASSRSVGPLGDEVDTEALGLGKADDLPRVRDRLIRQHKSVPGRG
jgi:hypothetical protein